MNVVVSCQRGPFQAEGSQVEAPEASAHTVNVQGGGHQVYDLGGWRGRAVAEEEVRG